MEVVITSDVNHKPEIDRDTKNEPEYSSQLTNDGACEVKFGTPVSFLVEVDEPACKEEGKQSGEEGGDEDEHERDPVDVHTRDNIIANSRGKYVVFFG